MLEKIRRHFANPINKKAASITALALIVLAIPLTVFISQQQQELRQRAQEVTAKGGGAYVSLVLAPSILEKAPGETFDAELYFDAQTYSITGVDVTINYNPSILQIERFTPVSTFNNVLVNKSISNNIKGEYRYAAVDTASAPQTGRITVGIITFKAQNTIGTSYVDLNNTQITALGRSDSIPTADNTQGKYVVAVPTPTPTTAPTETPISTTPTSIPTPEPVSACSTLYNKIIKYFGASCGDATYDKAADLNKNKRISAADYSKFLTYSNNVTTCENALNDPIDPCTTPGTTTAPAQPTPTFPPSPSPTPTPVVIQGDANGDGTVDILDFNIWRDEFLLTFGKPTIMRADFNKDGRVDLLDFSIWRNAIGSSSPTSGPITTTPLPNPISDLSITINPSSVPTKVTVATAEKTKLFDVTSTGAIQIQAGVTFNSGLFADPSKQTAMTRGQTVPVNIEGGNFTKAGVYKVDFSISTITQENPTVKTFSFPLEVTVAYANKSSRVFVTSVDFKGDLSPYNGNGDNVCTNRARIAGLGGVWAAWLSSTNNFVGGPAQHFIKYSGPYKTINGTVNGGVIANNWDDLVKGSLQWHIDKDEFGRDRAGVNVWTGTNTNGTLITAPYTGNCNNWSSSNSQALGWIGNSAYGDQNWTKQNWISPTAGSASDCDRLNALYCFEQ